MNEELTLKEEIENLPEECQEEIARVREYHQTMKKRCEEWVNEGLYQFKDILENGLHQKWCKESIQKVIERNKKEKALQIALVMLAMLTNKQTEQ